MNSARFFIHLSTVSYSGIFVCLWLLCQCGTAQAASATITGDGSGGPYPFVNELIDPHSLSCSIGDLNLPCTWVREENALLFQASIDQGTVVQVEYTPLFSGIKNRYRLYAPLPYVPDSTFGDSLFQNNFESLYGTPLAAGPSSNTIVVDGFKSITLSSGSSGGFSIEQQLDLTLSGSIAESTTVSGHISDQGSTLDGTTREISELDKIFIELIAPRYGIRIGDITTSFTLPNGFTEKKQLKGVRASVHMQAAKVRGFASLSGGTYTRQIIAGRTGFQGPYQLQAEQTEERITPIANTITVRKNGTLLAEGHQADYTVDYLLGSITFTENQIVLDGDVFTLEYEYKTFDYLRTSAGIGAEVFAADSALSIAVDLITEGDSKNRPIEQNFTEQDLQSLRAAGDQGVRTPSAQPVHPLELEETAALFHLYTLDEQGFFVYSPVLPADSLSTRQHYIVDFKKVAMNQGDYLEIAGDYRGPRYEYVGAGNGNAVSTSLLVAPTRKSKVRAKVATDTLAGFYVSSENWVEQFDQNTFSSLNDENNTTFFTQNNVGYQHRFDSVTSAELSVHFDATQDPKTFALIEPYQLREKWFINAPPSDSASQQLISGNFRARGRALKQLSYTSQVLMQHAAPLANRHHLHLNSPEIAAISARAEADVVFDSLQQWKQQFAQLSVHHNRTSFSSSLKGLYELQRIDSAHSGMQAGVGAEFATASGTMQQSVVYTRLFRATARGRNPVDTGYTLDWQQKLFREIKPLGLQMQYQHSLRHQKKAEAEESVLLGNGQIEYSPTGSGFSTTLNARLTYEQASTVIQVPQRVVEGTGTHRYNDTLAEYVPSPGGRYILINQEIEDRSSSGKSRKADTQWRWSFTPPASWKGLLGDLSWQGEASVEENIAAPTSVFSQRMLPGISLFDTTIQPTYGRFSYEQKLRWSPNEQFYTLGRFLQLRDVLRGHVENSSRLELQPQLALPIRKHQLQLALDATYLAARREQPGYTVDLSDRSLSLTTSFVHSRNITLNQQSTLGSFSRSDQSGLYAIVSSSLRYIPSDIGYVKARYSYAQNRFDGATDYRLAQNKPVGQSHEIILETSLSMGTKISLNGSYRLEIVRQLASTFGRDIPALQGLRLGVHARF